MGARIAITLAALALAGCAGDWSGISESALSTVVLQLADLPEPFEQFDVGRQGLADAPSTRADLRRFGRVDAWKARFRPAGTATTRGPLIVESRG